MRLMLSECPVAHEAAWGQAFIHGFHGLTPSQVVKVNQEISAEYDVDVCVVTHLRGIDHVDGREVERFCSSAKI